MYLQQFMIGLAWIKRITQPKICQNRGKIFRSAFLSLPMTLFDHVSDFMAMLFHEICKIKTFIEIYIFHFFVLLRFFDDFLALPFEFRVHGKASRKRIDAIFNFRWEGAVVADVYGVRTFLTHKLFLWLVEIVERGQYGNNLKRKEPCFERYKLYEISKGITVILF